MIHSSSRSRIRRIPGRARYDRPTIDAILDEAWVCHVGFIHRGGPVVIPTIHVRIGDAIVLHGSPASRMIRSIAGHRVSVAVTLFDGLVLARSVFNHSMHYRSVVLFGTGSIVEDDEARLEAMRMFTEKLLPGRWGDARIPSEEEFRATAIVAIPIDEASAKISNGPPQDGPGDLSRSTWAGVVPFTLGAGEPVAAPDLRPGIPIPPGLGS